MNTSSMSLYLAVFAGGCLISLILTPVVKRFALAHGRVAIPRDTRWHRKETALLGGVFIFLATTVAWSVSAGLSGWGLHGQPILAFMICAACMFSLRLADDFFDMAPQQKLAVQVVIGSTFVFLGFRLNWTPSQTVNLMLSILWILGMTNAFNLLDNMDGLAAGIAFIAGSFLFLWHLAGNPNVRQILIVDNSGELSNGSGLRDAPFVEIVSNEINRGFGAAANQAIEKAFGEWILVLNPDMRLGEGCLQHLLDAARASGSPLFPGLK